MAIFLKEKLSAPIKLLVKGIIRSEIETYPTNVAWFNEFFNLTNTRFGLYYILLQSLAINTIRTKICVEMNENSV